MAGARALIVAAVMTLTARASAEPGAIRRVVLVNATPDLAHAARTALAPWTIEVVEEARATPVDSTVAAMIALDRAADRVAWLANGELIVVDATTGQHERRPAPDGASDPPAAASVALSLKTLLRLPPLPEIAALAPTAAVAAVAPTSMVATAAPPPPTLRAPPAREVADAAAGSIVTAGRDRIQVVPEAGGGVRFGIGGTVAVQPRVAVGLGIVHPRWRRWRPSLVSSFGPAVEAGVSGLQGVWSDVELGVQLGVELGVTRHLAVLPRIRVGLHRTHLDGRLPPQDIVDEAAYGGELAAELAIWLRLRPVRVGVGGGAGVWVGLPDYIRRNNVVFESAPVTVQVFASILVDL